MESLFLCALAHNSQVLSSETIPYPIGCIKSHYMANARQPADIQLFVYPQKFEAAFHQQRPTLVGFSNFMWNLDLSYTMAAAVKRASPETLVVFGGPNFPLEQHRQEAWLKDHPAVDVYINGEGEQPFLEVAELWQQCHAIPEIQRAGIYGTYAIVDGRLEKTIRVRADGFDDTPRIQDLDATPSPYLMGYLDEFLEDPALIPLMECNRGCPFSCTFCVDGIAARTKVNRVKVSRLAAELTYIAERYRGKNLMLADTNFGMYAEDVEFSRIIAATREKYHYPEVITASTGKNRKERILECSETLEGSLRISASVQSLNSVVLKNIKRSNISFEALVQISQRASNSEATTFSEVILSLPGDSKAAHFETVGQLVDSGLNQIRLHTLMVLDGSELGTDKERERWQLKSRFRVVPSCFGVYRFGSEMLKSVEIEEVCVENDSLPFADYVNCRRFTLTVTLFYNDRIFSEIAQVITNAGLKVSDWLIFVHEHLAEAPVRLQQIYDDFTAHTIGELRESYDELAHKVKQEPGVIEQYIRGEAGRNVLLSHQALVYKECVAELTQMAFRCAREFLRSRAAIGDFDERYFNQLERYSQAKKKDLLQLETVVEQEFDYDFIALEASGFTQLPVRTHPTLIHFTYLPWQKELWADQFRRFGDTPAGWTKMLSRVPIKKMHRRPVRPAVLTETNYALGDSSLSVAGT